MSFDWEGLLLLVEDGLVIPIVGRDLLTVQDAGEGGQAMPLDRLLARELTVSLGLDAADLSSEPGLNEVAVAYGRRGRRSRIYSGIKGLLDRLDSPPPPALRQLAEIAHFQLFVTTGFDSLLYDAVNQVRFGGQERAGRLAFSPQRQCEDLPGELAGLDRPWVAQILGVASPVPDYVVTEEDLLEFVYALQNPDLQPPHLFDELRRKSLLFLGCSFPDWLTRFLLRATRSQRLLGEREAEFFADRSTRADRPLVSFLRDHRAEVYDDGDAEAFVAELSRRWRERNPPAAPSASPAEPATGAPGSGPEDQAPRGAIFLSYAREDAAAVGAMRTALEGAGLEVWSDQRQLQPGVDWERAIESSIGRSVLFIAVLSRTSASRQEGYFMEEWRLAIERARRMKDDVTFIVPVLIDDTPERCDGIPDYFWTRHVERAPQGIPPASFIETVRDLVRGRRRAEKRLR